MRWVRRIQLKTCLIRGHLQVTSNLKFNLDRNHQATCKSSSISSSTPINLARWWKRLNPEVPQWTTSTSVAHLPQTSKIQINIRGLKSIKTTPMLSAKGTNQSLTLGVLLLFKTHTIHKNNKRKIDQAAEKKKGPTLVFRRKMKGH
jgi:hypothetical protein